MKTNVLFLILFSAIVFYSFSGSNGTAELIGCTELNGTGCVCHDLEESSDVYVRVEGPDTLQAGQTGLYRMYLSGGPAIAGGYNVAARFGVLSTVDSLSFWDYRAPNELTQAFPLPFSSPADTVFWEFAFTPGQSIGIDTIYSCGLSSNWDSQPDVGDYWAFGAKHPVVIIPEVPVELTSFTGTVISSGVELKWITATEINNSGFIVERSTDNIIFNEINFITGNGSTTETSYYNCIDKPDSDKKYFYRLKQIDFNGSFAYSEVISVILNNTPDGFLLSQNYPNPFNPSTTISFSIPSAELVKISVLNMLGEEIMILMNEVKPEGSYNIEFNAAGLTSGIYLYRFETSGFNTVRKMILLK
jgi:hypothetical protein